MSSNQLPACCDALDGELRHCRERLQNLLELSSDWYWEQDQEHRFVEISGTHLEASSNSFGKTRWDPYFCSEPVGCSWEDHRATLDARRPFRDLVLRITTTQGIAYYSINGKPIFDADGNFKGYCGVSKNVTESKRAEERIQYLANHDGLTALPNRAMFSETLNLAINNARRYHHNFAILFIDLDRFKIINDTLGHDAGDKLLQEIARRLTHTLRTSDVVARLGGDEFVALLQEIDDADQAAAVARKILSAVLKPVMLDGQECRVTASIGICVYPDDGGDEQTLMKNADIAMYRAKEDGKNQYRCFSAEIRNQSLERMALETSLRLALERNEFRVHYQPKLDLRARHIVGVEALLRWQHPELGMILPGQFIPLAEETGLIVPIGTWVLRAACAQNMAWQAAGLPPICVAVNLSARQLGHEDLLDEIAAALRDSGMDPQLLELELTESMVMQNHERARRTLEAIKAMGVRLAIDDFGVGYSSLAQIRQFPFDILKVDRSFISEISRNSEDQAIAQAIIAIGKTLNLTVVAEGVETAEQEAFLRLHQCDATQGFYFSKPVDADTFAQMLRQRAPGNVIPLSRR